VTLLFLSDIPWFGLHQRPQQLASRFAKRWPVLWIEPATLSRKINFTPRQIQPNLHILSLPQFPHNARHRLVRVLSALLSRIPFLRSILLRIQLFLLQRAIALLDGKYSGLALTRNEIGFFIQNFQLIGLVKYFHPTVVAFDYIDDAFGFVKFPQYVHEDWLNTIQRADVISATSPTLQRNIQKAHAVNVHLVSNGVEYEFFASSRETRRPPDLPPADTPIIGYVGSVYAWFDFDLMENLLKRMPDLQFVVVGHDHPGVRNRLNALSRHSNFFFLGYKPYDQVPFYLNHFDVGIIPFAKSMLTAAVNPVKLYEYSAAGVPTVATNFSDDLLVYNKIIFISGTTNEFIENLHRALRKSRDKKFVSSLRHFAQKHDWDTRAHALAKLMERAKVKRKT